MTLVALESSGLKKSRYLTKGCVLDVYNTNLTLKMARLAVSRGNTYYLFPSKPVPRLD